MKKKVRLLGRYALLYCILFGVTVGLIAVAAMPDWLARAGGCVGAGWWAYRLVGLSMVRAARRVQK